MLRTTLIFIALVFGGVATARTFTSALVGDPAADASNGYAVKVSNDTLLEYAFALNDKVNVSSNATQYYAIYLNSTESSYTMMRFRYPSNDSSKAMGVYALYNQSSTPSGSPTSQGNGLYLEGAQLEVHGAVNFTVDGRVYNTLTTALGVGAFNGLDRARLTFYNDVNVNAYSRYPLDGVRSSRSDIYFYGRLNVSATARGTLQAVRTDNLGRMHFHGPVTLYNFADWSGDNSNIVYNDNVNSVMTFNDSLLATGRSLSSTIIAIRSQGRFTAQDVTIQIEGPRTAMGVGNWHYQGVMRFNGLVKMTVRGGSGTFGDTYGINNGWGGKIYQYGDLWANATTTGSSSTYGIASKGLYHVNETKLTLIVNNLGSGPLAYGMLSSADLDLYHVVINTTSWNSERYSIGAEARVTINCVGRRRDYLVQLDGDVELARDTNATQLCLNLNTSDSFLVGRFRIYDATEAPQANVTFARGSVWYYSNNFNSNGSEDHSEVVAGGSLVFDKATLNLASYPTPASNTTLFPVKHLTFTPQGRLATSVVANRLTVQLRSDVNGTMGPAKSDSVVFAAFSSSFNVSIQGKVTLSLLYDAILNDTALFRSRTSITLYPPQRLLLFRAPGLRADQWEMASYHHSADGLSVRLIPSAIYDEDSSAVFLTRLTISSEQASSSSSSLSDGDVAGIVIGILAGAGLILVGLAAGGFLIYLFVKKRKHLSMLPS